MNKTENMAAMLLTLTQSDEWFRLCDSDELTEQLWEAVCRVCETCSAVATLYGIRVVNAIRDVSAESLSLTMQALRQSRAKIGTQEGTTQNESFQQ